MILGMQITKPEARYEFVFIKILQSASHNRYCTLVGIQRINLKKMKVLASKCFFASSCIARGLVDSNDKITCLETRFTR